MAELQGMSGGATANGNGYTGLVHATQDFTSRKVSMACVIPFSVIARDCIDLLLQNPTLSSKLKTPKQCPGVKVLDIPEF